jgi:hypothetical protein
VNYRASQIKRLPEQNVYCGVTRRWGDGTLRGHVYPPISLWVCRCPPTQRVGPQGRTQGPGLGRKATQSPDFLTPASQFWTRWVGSHPTSTQLWGCQHLDPPLPFPPPTVLKTLGSDGPGSHLQIVTLDRCLEQSGLPNALHGTDIHTLVSVSLRTGDKSLA